MKVLCALCTLSLSILFGSMSFADEEGIDVFPYAAATLDRVSGPDEWSTGVTFGADLVKEPLFINAHFDAHDVLGSGDDVYPWDTTFGLGLGIVEKGYHVLGIDTSPYGALTLDRPSTVEDWSTGFNLGIEASFEPVWLELRQTWHDVLSTKQVYPWDQTFRIAVGVYFGGDSESQEATSE